MIDEEGFRRNIAIVILNRKDNRIFWGKRIRQTSWQFPQGGLAEGESVLAAMYRELHEEVGLRPYQVEVVAVTKSWLRYKIPVNFRRSVEPICIGQKQKWFLLRLLDMDAAVNLSSSDDIPPEFTRWRWVSYWYPVNHVIHFKKHVYRRALETFSKYVYGKSKRRRSR